MSTDILREYLVALGFKIDDASYKKFTTSVAGTAKSAADLGVVVTAAATAVAVAVDRVSREFESLYFSAQRTGSSAASLKTFEYAFTQVGQSAESARAAVEAVAAAIRTQPGLQNVLRMWGVTEEELKDPKKAMLSGIGKLKDRYGPMGGVGYAAAAQQGTLLRLDEPTFRSIWQNLEKIKSEESDLSRKQAEAGVDVNKLADSSNKFREAMRGLEASFDVITSRITGPWMIAAEGVVRWLDDLLQRFSRFNNAKEGVPGQMVAVTAAGVAAGAVGALGKRAYRFFGKVTQKAPEIIGDATKTTTTETAKRWVASRWLSWLGGPAGALLGMTRSAGESDAAERARIDPEKEKEYRRLHPEMFSARPSRGVVSLSAHDRDLLIRTVIGEAGREPDEGKAAVAHTVLNRLKSGKYGNDIPNVVLAPKQFEPWTTRANELMAIKETSAAYRKAAAIVDDVLSGKTPDQTNGALNFADVDVVRSRGNGRALAWIEEMYRNGTAMKIGQHTFGDPAARPGSNAAPVAKPSPEAPSPAARPALDAIPTARPSPDLPPAVRQVPDLTPRLNMPKINFDAPIPPPMRAMSQDITIAPKTEINITGVSDAGEVARLTGKEMDRTNGDIVRNFQGAVR